MTISTSTTSPVPTTGRHDAVFFRFAFGPFSFHDLHVFHDLDKGLAFARRGKVQTSNLGFRTDPQFYIAYFARSLDDFYILQFVAQPLSPIGYTDGGFFVHATKSQGRHASTSDGTIVYIMYKKYIMYI